MYEYPMKKLLLHTTLGLSVFVVSTFLYANVHAPSFYHNKQVQVGWVERWFTLNEATTIYGLSAATAHMNISCVTHTLAVHAPAKLPLLPDTENPDKADLPQTLGYSIPCYAHKLLSQAWTCPAPHTLASEQDNTLLHHPLNHQGGKVSPFSLPSLVPMRPDMPSSLYRVRVDGPNDKWQL